MKKNKTSLAGFLSGMIVLMSVLFLAMTSMVFINIYKSSITESATVGAEQAVSLVRENMDMSLYSANQDFFLIENKVRECSSESELKQYLNSVVSVRNGISSIMIFDLKGNLLSYGVMEGELKRLNSNNMSFLSKTFDDGGRHVSAPHVQNMFTGYYPWVITIGYRVPSKLYEEEVYLAIDVDFNSMLSYIDSVKIGQRGYCFVMDTEGNLVYHPQQQLIYSGLKSENLDWLEGLDDGTVVQGECIYSVMSMPDYAWRVVGISYTDEMITDKIQLVYRSMFWIFGVCLIVLLVVIRIISNMASKPVNDLTKAMREFERQVETFQYRPVRGLYEVESLSDSFEHMVGMIQKLMLHIKDEEKTLRKTELKALQSQINPHFLYNTLDSIQWMCERGDKERAVEMVGALAKLFRISISKGREFIPIEQELAHVENYLIIQSFRYKDKFRYHIETEGDITDFYCNKITLQPLVENAIIHGVGDLCDDEGEILIRVSVEEDRIVFIVKDNGIGMTREQCEKITRHDASNTLGIGIKNVKDRLVIYFGEKAGLSVESELDVGTAITLYFPLLTAEDLKKEGLQ